MVLGTGLGALAEEIAAEATIPYPEIPHFPQSTVESHKGQLVCGTLAGQSVVAMEGRFHLYEGYTAAQVDVPDPRDEGAGLPYLIVSNAAGGLNPLHRKGDLMVIEDHINLLGLNPLIGPNDDRLGPRFPDLIEPYDQRLQKLALQAALEANIVAHRGVYVAVTGPNLETRAEYRFLRGIGADVVGMSTVPEVLVAVHAGLRVLGFSIVTDLLPARRPGAGEHRGDHRRRERGRGQAPDDRPAGAGTDGWVTGRPISTPISAVFRTLENRSGTAPRSPRSVR